MEILLGVFNCLEYQDAVKCSKCKYAYYLDTTNNLCVLSVTVVPNCFYYLGEGVCLECISSYYVHEGVC